MSERKMLRERTSSLLERFGKLLEQNPAATYEMWAVLTQLDNWRQQAEARADEYFLGVLSTTYTRVHVVWSEYCSAASGRIPIDSQERIIRALGHYLAKVGESLKREPLDAETAMRAAGRMAGTLHEIEVSLASHKLAPQYDVIQNLERDFDLENRLGGDVTKARVIRLIRDTGAFWRSREPVFLLKAGIRSYHFFSGASLHSTSQAAYRPLLQPLIQRMIESIQLDGGKPVVAGARRAVGETGGAMILASEVAAEYGFPLMVLSPPSIEHLIDRVDTPISDENAAVIFFDDVVTTGLSSGGYLKRLYDQGIRPKYYVVTFDRRSNPAPRIEQFPDTEVISIVNKLDLIAAGMWIPEILLCDTDSKWVSSLEFECDYLLEMCVYFGIPDRYADLAARIDEIIATRMNTGWAKCAETITFHRNLALLFVTDVWALVRGAAGGRSVQGAEDG